MCIALPLRIVEVLDEAARLVAVAPEGDVAADRASREVVSAALLVDDAAGLADLVGGWGLVHAGFLLARIDEEDARSRLAVFAAMDRSLDAETDSALVDFALVDFGRLRRHGGDETAHSNEADAAARR